MATIDLNADLGEGFPWDEALLDRVTSASVSCGAHAGDETTILRTLALTKERGVTVGAHPGYADRKGFGRREQPIGFPEAHALVRDQLLRLHDLASRIDVKLEFVKPHGALYNQAQRTEAIARGIAAAVAEFPGQSPALLGLPGSEVEKAAREFGLVYVAEGFADRGYRDGRLIPRNEPGAHLDNPSQIADQIVRLASSGQIQTLCLHGDDAGALTLAKLVRKTLTNRGIAIRGFVQ